MPTAEFIALKSRLKKLALSLPDATIARAALTPDQEEEISFFSITAHATCEHFMEERCLIAATKSYDDYNNSSFFGRIAKHLCVMPFVTVPKDQNDLKKMIKVYGGKGFGISVTPSFHGSNANELKELIHIGYQKYKQIVVNNHGMGLKYQFSLIAMLGQDVSQFDPTFRTRVSQLATLRGEAAHNAVVAAQTIPEPSDLAQWTTDLIAGYRRLDTALVKLCKRKQ
ncbi:hypothetical protein [Rhizobium ruizarguesonis]|jgi:hypothetical protein|uniref:hypothetical protein n=1 Tax=Rhizobium ruizarguesonis TaxID=2081791 RepID=UPI00102F4B59|nr:hypothetical protein [Rhizobium ruizarguesonis]TBC11350.1 hypothetical protein ELH37_20660 [Rhizobium ruizarguesonis]TBC59406.1 hypothetical protein ELH32_20860 [Rhizobium ruizarguesonis]